MGGCRCVFRDCTVSTSRHPRMHFFRFPIKDPERFDKWIKMANVPYIKTLSPSQQKNKVVCARHFRTECFMNYLRDKLVAKAVPTLKRLKDGFAIDYDTEGEPHVVRLPQPTSPYMIPPPDFECPLYLDEIDEEVENCDLDEGSDCVVLIREPTEEQTEMVATKPNTLKKRHLSNVEEASTNKIKILNVEAPENDTDNRNISKSEDFVSTFVNFLDLSEDQQENYMLSISDSGDEDDETNDKVLKIQYITGVDVEKPKIPIKTYNHVPSQESTSRIDQKQCKSCQEYEVKLKKELSNYASLEEDTSKQIVQLVEALQAANREIEERKSELEEIKENAHKTQQMLENLEKQNKQLRDESEKLRISNRVLKSRLESQSIQHKSVVKLKEELEAKNLSLQQKQQQVSTVSTSGEAPAQAQVALNTTGPPPSISKAQLFYGIRRYLNGAMISFLRMEMFGNADRDWKPDEKRVAMDLLGLGESVYLYFTEEWRFRLPTLRQVQEWASKVADNQFEEDL